ncbi:MAG TPA: hypothetical protein VLA22_05950 [Gaiellaceae bacterium]|nr:hypothetical protein [Gaiellaceae bacterium]
MAGAAIEALLGLAVIGLFVAIWLRERRARGESGTEGSARLRGEDEPPPP